MNDPKRSFLIVLGTGRCGTSAMTGIIDILGANLGGELKPADHDNVRGYWEHAEILKVTTTLRQELGSFWYDIRPLPNNWVDLECAKKAQGKLLSILKRDFCNSQLPAVKDPRLAKYIPIWYPVLNSLDLQPKFLVLFRHPLEVVNSLKKNNDNLSTNRLLMFWLIRSLELEYNTQGYPRVFLSFNSLLNDWENSIREISRILGLKWPRSANDCRAEVDRFLSSRLKHQYANSYPTDIDEKTRFIVETVYKDFITGELLENNGVLSACAKTRAQVSSEMGSMVSKALMEDLTSSITSLHQSEIRNATITNSISWQLTKPLRFIYNTIYSVSKAIIR